MQKTSLLFLLTITTAINACQNSEAFAPQADEISIFKAIHNNDLKILKSFYQVQDPWLFNSTGLSPLAYAIYSAADVGIIEYILRLEGGCANFKGKKDTIDIGNNNFCLLEILLKKTPVCFQYKKMLLQHKPYAVQFKNRYSYLHNQESYLRKVAILLFEHGTLLRNCSPHNDNKLIEYAKGTCLYNAYKNNSYNSKGHTNLHIAIHNGDHNKVEKLLKEDASVNVRERYYSGLLPTELAIASRDHRMLSLLLNNGAQVNFKRNKLLSQAAMAYDIESVRLLLMHGANPTIDNPPVLSHIDEKYDPALYGLLVAFGATS